jgi:hypothetical protein
VSGNAALGFGGGVHAGYVTLTNSTVSGNTAEYAGGGIFTNWGTLTNSTVSGNAAEYTGGGIFSYYDVTLTNSTLSGNTTYSVSSGFYGLGLTLTNTTVSGNTGGTSVIDGYYLTFTNTIMADNGTIICSAGGVSEGYNLVDDTSCNLTEPTDLVVADAMLGPLQDNGGPTETHDLLPGSPAIDAGSVDCPPPDTDQRGVARPQGTACDIGAVEYLPEPASWLMLVAGTAFLGLLYRRRVRRLRFG